MSLPPTPTRSHKQRVLERYPDAVCLRTPTKIFVRYDVWHRIDTAGVPLESGKTPAEAWMRAAKYVEETDHRDGKTYSDRYWERRRKAGL